MMSEKPILFSGQMVRAILDGRKTMTRRVAKIIGIMGNKLPVTAEGERLIELEPGEFNRGVFHYESLSALSGPYRLPAAVGDMLWVREALQSGGDASVVYQADGAVHPDAEWVWKRLTLPSTHCPRGLSRITLKVTGVKVERLQDISSVDAELEGVNCDMSPRTFIDHFRNLWNSINGPGSWDANPWVSAISFERVTAVCNAVAM